MPEATFPTPLHSASYDSGPRYMKYLKVRKDYSEVTLISTYEDQGRDFNTSADDAPQRWELFYDGLADEDANILDAFWDAHKLHVTFTFIEPRDHPWTFQEGGTHTGVRFESYEKDHEKVKGIQTRTVRLVKYPT
jgi:hypothetical protein